MRLLNDIRAFPTLTPENKRYLIAFLVALSGILSILDSMIPKPIPFVKLGIANIITLVLVMEGKNKIALEVAFLRTLLSAMVMGTLLTYTHLLSATGAIGSVLMTILLFSLLKDKVSAIGLSVWGAFFSVAFQASIVILFFGWDSGILMFISIFLLTGLVNGIIIGLLVRGFYKKAGQNISIS